MKQSSTWDLRTIILTGLFASLVTIVTSFRIPLPALIGSPFVHFGSSIFMLAVLLLGFWPGALAGGIGFALFDVMNGFAIEAPYFILESLVIAFVITISFKTLNKDSTQTPAIFIPVILGALTKIIMTFLKNLVMGLYIGATFPTAVISSASSLYITLINAVVSIIFVNIAYYPLKAVLSKNKKNIKS